LTQSPGFRVLVGCNVSYIGVLIPWHQTLQWRFCISEA